MSFHAALEDGKRAFRDGRYFEGADILAAALDLIDSNAVPDDQQADLFLEYGRVLSKLARYDDSLQYLNKAKSIYERDPGPESFEYSETLKELGVLDHQQNHLPEAMRTLKEVLSIRRMLYQPPHKDIAEVLNAIGEVAWKDGDNKEALGFLEEALEMQKLTIGEIDRLYADTLENHSLVLSRLGQSAQAEAGFRKSLEIRQACLTPDHPSFGTSFNNLAAALAKQGKNDGVEEMKKHALAIYVKSYGEDNPHTAAAANNLGAYYLNHGKLDEALQCCERSLSIKERLFGKENQSLWVTLVSLSQIYSKLNRTDEARECRNRSQSLLEAKILSNPKDVDAMIYLGNSLYAEKKLEEASEIFKQANAVAASEFGAGSLKAAEILNLLGIVALNKSDVATAQDHFARVLRIQKRELGKKHAKVAETLRHLSSCLLVLGLGDTVVLLNMQAKAIQHALGAEDPQLAALRKNYEKQLATRGATDTSVIQFMRFLSETYRRHGKSKESDALYDEYLQAREKERGPDSLELAQELAMKALVTLPTRTNLLRMQAASIDDEDIDEEETNKAIAYLQKATGIQERVLTGADNEDLVTSLGQLASAYALIRKFDQAEQTARRAVELAEKSAGNSHWSLAVPLMHLKGVLDAQGKREDAEAVEQRRKQLPAPTAAESNASTNRRMKKAMGSMGRMLQTITTISETSQTNPPAERRQADANES